MKILTFLLNSRRILLLSALSVFALLYVAMKPYTEIHAQHSCRSGEPMDSLWEGDNAEFASSGKCDHCHGLDAAGIASVDGEGADVNLVDDWSSTMMANSARDPFWRAKVSHEIMINPSMQSDIEATCTKCHAPLGRFAASMNGQEGYSIAEMEGDGVAMDGVSCLACHRQLPQPEVALHTGNLIFDDDSIAYGPYFNPLITPMALYSGYSPEHGFQVRDAKLCAACHSLVTPTVDLEGQLTGGEFIEQATWHEWLNSSYPVQEISCQSCHLPTLGEQAVKLAAGYDTPPRSPFGLHTLAGGNVTMLNMLRDNRETLGIYASEDRFNETISATLHNLQEQSLQVELTEVERTEDTLYVDVKLTNITGHKLPSGYPSRRMTLILFAENNGGEEIFRSGSFDEDHYVVGEDEPFEPHHTIINDEDQVQIYEMVMGNVNGEPTNVLLQGAVHLKDNRLVPLGFMETGALYDTTEIVLNIPDTDFNHDPNTGSGTDVIHYRIPLDNYTGEITVDAAIYYQSVPPTWLDGILTLDTPEANTFESMYNETDASPVLMRSAELEIDEYSGINTMQSDFAILQATNGGGVSVYSTTSFSIGIYNAEGKLIYSGKGSTGKVVIDFPHSKGMYICVLTSSDGRKMLKKLVL